MCSGRYTMETIRKLFGSHVLLGFAGETGWKMVDAMLGAGFIKAVAFVTWILAVLAVAQALFLARAFKGRWWCSWQRWHYAAVTLSACHFVLVMLWWGFGGWPS